MQKTATIIISLVEQAGNITSHNKLAKDIKESLRCDWLANVKKVRIETCVEQHHSTPSSEEVQILG